eukprot:4715452-Prymnesium_polylepis.1
MPTSSERRSRRKPLGGCDARAPTPCAFAGRHEKSVFTHEIGPPHFETPERISRRNQHLETSPARLKTGWC